MTRRRAHRRTFRSRARPTLEAALCAALLLAATARAAEEGGPAPPAGKSTTPRAGRPTLPDDPARLIDRLGNDSARVRDAALEALVALGEPALPVLQKARAHPDAEIRWRVHRALHRIRWRVGEALAKRIGELMRGFEDQPVGRRELICRDLAMVGLTEALPTLQQILKTDPSRAVRQAAARALVVLGDAGLAALLDAGVKTEGLEAYTLSVRIHLGNAHLEKGRFQQALEQYRLALEIEPGNPIAHYNIACTYARMERVQDALDALERAVAHGYRDAEWMAKDSDLENLRDEPRFRALLRKLRALQEE